MDFCWFSVVFMFVCKVFIGVFFGKIVFSCLVFLYWNIWLGYKVFGLFLLCDIVIRMLGCCLFVYCCSIFSVLFGLFLSGVMSILIILL